MLLLIIILYFNNRALSHNVKSKELLKKYTKVNYETTYYIFVKNKFYKVFSVDSSGNAYVRIREGYKSPKVKFYGKLYLKVKNQNLYISLNKFKENPNNTNLQSLEEIKKEALN
jgi:hypothetical protein